jgi:asparagine synthase (glutamine-hydrolysing)
MLDIQAHRGPDDEGQHWIDAGRGFHLGLGSRRLAILDLSAAGHQPMLEHGRVLVYNGEVYNWQALREELRREGPFASGTDTEVVLRTLTLHGAAGLGRLNGMFGLAFWDPDTEELLLARDRFGIKPLYYWEGPGGQLAFSSELKGLLPAGIPREIDPVVLARYLDFGYVPGDESILVGVKRLPPDTVLRWRRGVARLEPIPRRAIAVDDGIPEADAALAVRDAIRDAVRRQLVADVPVGVFLSGGIDSTTLLAAAAAETSAPIRAYTIGFREQDARLEQNPEDAFFARRMADHFGAELHELVVRPDLLELLPRAAWHLDEPLGDPAAILTLLISERAASECTVLLSGQGADELFAGYRVHLYDRVARAIDRLPAAGRRALVSAVGALPTLAERPWARPGLTLAVHRALTTVLEAGHLNRHARYVAFRSANQFGRDAVWELLDPGVREAAFAQDPRAVHFATRAEHDGEFLDWVLAVDVRTFLEGQNLMYSDRLSMAASIELRVPYLDDAVADLAMALPANLKLRGFRGKHVLRRAVDGFIPHEVVRRRKAGFGAPVRSWLRNDLRDVVGDTLSAERFAARGWLNPAEARRIVQEHQLGVTDHTYRIWTLLGLEMWARAYLDEPVAPAAGSRTKA